MNRSLKISYVAHAHLVQIESKVMRGPVLFPLGVTFFIGFFLFSRSITSAANIGILVHFEKTLLECILV